MTSSSLPPSQTGLPSSNAKYIAVAALLLLGMGALLFFRSKPPQETPTSPAAASASQTAAMQTVRREEEYVPPPPPVEDAGAHEAPKATAAANPCAVTVCNGKSTSELEGALQARARQSRSCYNTALAQDSSLQGHVKLSVRVAANGTVCGARVVSNDMGSSVVADCVATKFRQAAGFPAPKGGCADIEMPLSFLPPK